MHYVDLERPQINTSVRTLVEFIYKTGDIDDGSGGMDSKAAMEAGSKLHKKLQDRGGTLYHAEFPLSILIDMGEYDLAIDGRADGIIYDVDEEGTFLGVIVDEIKGMYADVMAFEEPIAVHLAQALCYGYIFSEQNEIKTLSVQMTYGNLETDEINRFLTEYSQDYLREWFELLIEKFRKWSDFIYYHRKERNETIIPLAFPFEYREGQKDLVSDVYRTIKREKTLFIQAPTGCGKTISTVYPSVMSMGQNLSERVFYLTAKTAVATVARDTFSLLNDRGYAGITVQITAKDKVCILEKRSCNPKDCEHACGHYDRINDAIYDVITHERMVTREVIEEYAIKHKVCPFELSLDVSNFCDHIICDYNYVFDPNVYLKRYFAEGNRSKAILLVDEAHNMVDRGREMYSVTFNKEEFLRVKNYVKDFDKPLSQAIEKGNKALLAFKRQCEGDKLMVEDVDELSFAVFNAQVRIEKLLAKRIKFGEHHDEVIDFYFKLRDYSAIMDDFDFDHYRIYCEFVEKEFLLHVACIDPSSQLQKRIDKCVATVYFSATLLPINYYKQLLTAKDDVYAIYAKSIFDVNKRLLLVANDVTSKYKRRGLDEYDKFARYIRSVVDGKKGNYMVFGPSYAFCEQVESSFYTMSEGVDVISQTVSMSEAKREEFLKEFECERENSLVAFCTMGGIFSEGIDLTDDKLIGVIILGAGLPQVGNERVVMSDFFDKTGKNGFEYAYLYPGLNKVVQSAGRLIRTENDVGVIALLDERFTFSTYYKCFPREWDNRVVTNVENVSDFVDDFWNKNE